MSQRRKSEVYTKTERKVEYLSKKVQTLKVTSISRETRVKYLIDREKSMGETNDMQKTKSKPKTFYRNKASDGNRNRNSSTHRPSTYNQSYPILQHYNTREEPNPGQCVHIHNQNSGSNVDIVISHSDRPINCLYRHDGLSDSHRSSSNTQKQYSNPNMNRFPRDNPPPYHNVPPPPYSQVDSSHFSYNPQDTFYPHSNKPPLLNLERHHNFNPQRNQNQPHQQFNPLRNLNQHHQQFTRQASASNKETPNTQYRPQSTCNQKGQNNSEQVKDQKPGHINKMQKEECTQFTTRAPKKEIPGTQYKPQSKGNQKGQNHREYNSEPEHVKHQKHGHTNKMQKKECTQLTTSVPKKEAPGAQYKTQSKCNQKAQNHREYNSEPEHVKQEKPKRINKMQKKEYRSSNKRHK